MNDLVRSRWRGLPLLGVLAGIGLMAIAVIGLMAAGFGGSTSSALGAPVTFSSAPPSIGAPTPVRTAGSAPPRRIRGAPPALLTLPAGHVEAPVEQVVTTNGVLGVPEDPGHVGWWTGSARPGAPVGSVVIDGHVDSATRGIGALYHLIQLQSGDPISLTGADGSRWTYRVYARQSYSKHQPLPAGLFATAGAPRLVLITCGGAFNSATRSYEDNIVVLAALQHG